MRLVVLMSMFSFLFAKIISLRRLYRLGGLLRGVELR